MTRNPLDYAEKPQNRGLKLARAAALLLIIGIPSFIAAWQIGSWSLNKILIDAEQQAIERERKNMERIERARNNWPITQP